MPLSQYMKQLHQFSLFFQTFLELTLDHLYQQVETVRQRLLLEVEMAIDQAHNFQLAAEKLRALLFIDKFSVELEDAMSA